MRCVFTFITFCVLSAYAVTTNWPAAQYLMVDQHGSIVPEGYAAGLTEIAQMEAEAAAVGQSAQLLTDTTESASNVVNAVVDALTGVYGTAYVTGHTVSFSGALEISTNVNAQIVFAQFGGAGSMTTNGTTHTGHYIWHVYSEEMNTIPAIKYKRVLEGTNSWEFAEYQSTSLYVNTTVNEVLYDFVYRSTVWLPAIYDTAFFITFCEISGGGQAGGVLDITEGLSIGGKVGYTGVRICNGYKWTYQTGLLMAVEPEVQE